MKESHEIRDAIHGFVRLTTRERRLIDSPAIQRLRHVHQLATTFMVYPGATHSRFEHSLGVADLATRIFDVVVREDNLRPVQDRLGMDRDEIEYWGRVLRVAALCHDIGHLPFSHAAEYELLPPGWNHERITRALMDFLKARLPGGRFATDIASHLALSDPKVISAIQDVAADAELPGHDAAHRMLTRRHYRRVYEPRPADMHVTSDPGLAVYEALCSELDAENVKRDVSHDVGGIGSDFPVALEGGETASALSVSQVLQLQLPMGFDVVYVKPEMAEHARNYLGVNISTILEKHAYGGGEG